MERGRIGVIVNTVRENQKGGRGERKKKTQGTISPSAHHK